MKKEAKTRKKKPAKGKPKLLLKSGNPEDIETSRKSGDEDDAEIDEEDIEEIEEEKGI